VSPLAPDLTTDAYALFREIPSDRSFRFYLASINSRGSSRNSSEVVVPRSKGTAGRGALDVLSPRSVTKVDFPGSVYQLSWEPPLDSNRVTSYTVFWCRSNNGRERPYQCDGQLDWRVVEKGETLLNLTMPSPEVYQLAVSSNVASSEFGGESEAAEVSSGMVWTTCTILHNKVIGRMKPVVVSARESRRISVRWYLQCLDRAGLITGYQVSYCSVDENDPSATCATPMVVVNAVREADQIWLEGLDPWTYYKVAIAMTSKDQKNEPSEWMVARTRATRPDTSVTDLSAALRRDPATARLTWVEPAKPNGQISSYRVRHTHTDFVGNTVHKEIRVEGSKNSVDVTELDVNTHYRFDVRTCVRVDSSEEDVCGAVFTSVELTTGVGVSGRMEEPRVRFINTSHFQLSWPDPFHQGGPILRYEVKIASQALGAWHVMALTRTGDLAARRSLVNLHKIASDQDWAPDCSNASVATNLYNVSIRAVTVDWDTQKVFVGPWSGQTVQPNPCNDDNTIAIVLGVMVGVFLMIVAMIIMYYSCKFGYRNKKVSNKVGGRLGRGVTGVIQSGDRDMATFKPVHQGNGYLKGPAELNRGDGGAGPGSVSGTGSSSVKNGSGRMEMTAIPDKDKSARDLQFQLSTTSTSASQVDNGQTIINGSIKKNVGEKGSKRNASGTSSDSASGCESGRNYGTGGDSESEQSTSLVGLQRNDSLPTGALPPPSTGYVAAPPVPPLSNTPHPPHPPPVTNLPPPSSGYVPPPQMKPQAKKSEGPRVSVAPARKGGVKSEQMQFQNNRLPKGYSQVETRGSSIHPGFFPLKNHPGHPMSLPTTVSNNSLHHPSPQANSLGFLGQKEPASRLEPAPQPTSRVQSGQGGLVAPSGGGGGGYLSLAAFQRRPELPAQPQHMPPGGGQSKYLQATTLPATPASNGYVQHNLVQPARKNKVALTPSVSQDSDEEDCDKTITPLDEYNPSQELLQKKKKHKSKPVVISPKALQEGGHHPLVTNGMRPSDSGEDQDPKFRLHHVVGNLNTGSLV